jgi:hypothetical protein
MHSHIAETQGIETFHVPLEGFIVECESVADAVAVKNADEVLSDRGLSSYAPVELDRLADVLTRYGRQSAANVLRSEAQRRRAAAFLTS